MIPCELFTLRTHPSDLCIWLHRNTQGTTKCLSCVVTPGWFVSKHSWGRALMALNRYISMCYLQESLSWLKYTSQYYTPSLCVKVLNRSNITLCNRYHFKTRNVTRINVWQHFKDIYFTTSQDLKKSCKSAKRRGRGCVYYWC